MVPSSDPGMTSRAAEIFITACHTHGALGDCFLAPGLFLLLLLILFSVLT